jgi:hypothetical protein
MNGQEHFRMPSAFNISTIPPPNEKRHARLLAFHDGKKKKLSSRFPLRFSLPHIIMNAM